MATQIQRTLSMVFNGDGVSTTATFTVTDLCLFSQLAVGDLTPLDAAVNAIWINSVGNVTTPITAVLNSKGTAVTFTFPSAPPVNSGNQTQEIVFVAIRLSQ